MEIEKNMYVRVKDNKGITYIRKIIDVADKTMKLYYYIAVDKDTRTTNYVSKKNVIKSSYNIIDIIEENDIVEYRITGDNYISKVEGHPEFGKWKLNVYFYEEFIDLEKLDIISVLTHEQFDNIKYEVK